MERPCRWSPSLPTTPSPAVREPEVTAAALLLCVAGATAMQGRIAATSRVRVLDDGLPEWRRATMRDAVTFMCFEMWARPMLTTASRPLRTDDPKEQKF